MKKLKNTILVGLCLSAPVLFSCEQPMEEIVERSAEASITEPPVRGGAGEKTFVAKFVTSLTPTSETGSCVAPYTIYNNQEGHGKISSLGRFTTKITFCVNVENLQYVDGNGVFVMDDGDELYFTVSGQVLPSNHPKYDAEFHDPFVFTGGTGRYAGASGSGTTNSFVKFLPEGGDQTDHKWKGKLILPAN